MLRPDSASAIGSGSGMLPVNAVKDRTYNVLFLCTGNSARSILAEALMNRAGEGRFRAYSAGSFPKPDVHPMTLEVLRELGFPTDELRSKCWDEFAKPGGPIMDFIFTVCDSAAGETCPIWPGHPMTAHWGIEDPANADGPRQKQAFLTAMSYLKTRISLFMALPVEAIDEMNLRAKIKAIGRSEGATGRALT